MNLLAIFSSLVPDGEKAWLPGGFSARVFFFFLRSTKMTTLGYFQKLANKGGLKRGIPLKRNSQEQFGQLLRLQFRDFSKKIVCFEIPLLLFFFFSTSPFVSILLLFLFFLFSIRRNVFIFRNLKARSKSGIERKKKISRFCFSSSSSSFLFSFFSFVLFRQTFELSRDTEWRKIVSFFLFFFLKGQKSDRGETIGMKKKKQKGGGGGNGVGGGGGGIFVRTGHGTKVSSRISEGNNNNNNNAVDVRCHGGKKKFGTLPFISALASVRDCQSKKRRNRTCRR